MAVGNIELITTASATSATELDITNIFTSDYQTYKLVIPTWNAGGTAQELQYRYIDSGGSVIADSEYKYAAQTTRSFDVFQSLVSSGFDSKVHYIGYNDANSIGFGSVIYIHNPYESSSYTFSQWQSSTKEPSYGMGYKGIAAHFSAEQLSGIRFFGSGLSTFSSLDVKVYGVAKR